MFPEEFVFIPHLLLAAEAEKKRKEGAEFFLDFLEPPDEADRAAELAGEFGRECVALSAGFSVSTLSASCRIGRVPFMSLALHSMYAL